MEVEVAAAVADSLTPQPTGSVGQNSLLQEKPQWYKFVLYQ